jgi:hypothetical protein
MNIKNMQKTIIKIITPKTKIKTPLTKKITPGEISCDIFNDKSIIPTIIVAKPNNKIKGPA